jgi:spermidine synthase
LGKKIGLLYGVNTMGAVAGAFATGFILIPHVGVDFSNTIAGLMNLGICASAWILSEPLAPLKEASLEEKEGKANPKMRMLPVLAFATGFCGLAAEVVWNKYLGIFLGSNIFGLSLVLSLFLLGIAVGSLLLSSFVEKVKEPFRLAQALLLACIVSIYLTTRLLNFAPVAANVTVYYFPKLDFLSVKAFIAALVLFPSGLFLGALLPLLIRLRIQHSSRSAAVTGRLYAMNTIGSILGSCVSGLLLVPWLGSGATIRIALALLILASLAFTFMLKSQSSKRFLAFASVFALFLIALPVAGSVRFENIIKTAYFRDLKRNLTLQEVTKYFTKEQEEFLLVVEGKTGIISLSHDPQDGPSYKRYLRLKTNGLNESVYITDNLDVLPKYEALLGFLPLALVRNPEKAFVVGYGGGYTVDFLTSTDIDKVNVAELEEGILKAADYVYKGKNPIRSRRNLKLEIEDARFLLTTRSRGPFDIIVSQPSHSWLTGVANLFTKEFFVTVRDNLSSKGVFSQWLNLYNMNPEVLKSILGTFYTVFPHGFVFTNANDQEMIMIGSVNPVRFDLRKLAALNQDWRIRRKLSAIPITNPYDVLAQYTLSREEVLKLTKGAVTNTDRNAYAEVTQSRLFYKERNPFPSRFLLEAYSGDLSSLIQGKVEPYVYQGLLQAMENTPDRAFKALPLLDRLRSAQPKENTYEYAYQLYQMSRYATAEKELAKLKGHLDAASFHLALLNYWAMDRKEDALKLWKKYPQFRSGRLQCFEPEIYRELGNTRAAAQAVKQVEANYQQALTLCGPYLNKALGQHYLAQGDAVSAVKYLETYYAVAPTDLAGYRALLNAYRAKNDPVNAEAFAAYLPQLELQEKQRLGSMADFFDRKHFTEDSKVLHRLSDAIQVSAP